MGDISLVNNYLENFSYIGTFVLVSLTGYVIPFPEELMLISVGYLSAIGFGNVYILTIVSIAGLLAGDSIIFFLSLRGANFIERIKRKLNSKRIAYYEAQAREHLGKYVFGLRFVPSLRFLSPIIAGSMKTSWKKFLWYDTLAVFIYAPILIFLGFHFQNELALITHRFLIIRHAIFITLLIGLGVWITIVINRKFYEHINGARD